MFGRDYNLDDWSSGIIFCSDDGNIWDTVWDIWVTHFFLVAVMAYKIKVNTSMFGLGISFAQTMVIISQTLSEIFGLLIFLVAVMGYKIKVNTSMFGRDCNLDGWSPGNIFCSDDSNISEAIWDVMIANITKWNWLLNNLLPALRSDEGAVRGFTYILNLNFFNGVGRIVYFILSNLCEFSYLVWDQTWTRKICARLME